MTNHRLSTKCKSGLHNAQASSFGKLHKNVLRAIENLECRAEFYQRNFEPVIIECSADFRLLNFGEVIAEYKNRKGGTQQAPTRAAGLEFNLGFFLWRQKNTRKTPRFRGEGGAQNQAINPKVPKNRPCPTRSKQLPSLAF